jgi:hypothetical protein
MSSPGLSPTHYFSDLTVRAYRDPVVTDIASPLIAQHVGDLEVSVLWLTTGTLLTLGTFQGSHYCHRSFIRERHLPNGGIILCNIP